MVTILLQQPLDFMTVKPVVSVLIKLFKQKNKRSHAHHTFLSQSGLNLIEDCGWGLAFSTELIFDIWITASTFVCNPPGEFLIVQLARIIFVPLAEESVHFCCWEDATQSFKSLAEFLS